MVKGKGLIVASMMLLFTSAAQAQLPLDFDNRTTMIATVAIIMNLPPNCTAQGRSFDNMQIAQFIAAKGWRNDDTLLMDIKAKMISNDDGFRRLSVDNRKSVAELTCGYGIILSREVMEAIR
jgi:hypothetical protein